MLHRTIFIGLGSTGCNTIDALQDIAYLSTGDAEMGGAWAYLKLDTAPPSDHTFCGDKAHKIHIQVAHAEINDLKQHLSNLSSRPGANMDELKWLWDEGQLRVSPNIAGAGLNRRYARACVYYYWELATAGTGKNIKNWINDIKGNFLAPEDPRSPDNIEARLDKILPVGAPRPKVSRDAAQPFEIIIVATLAGGTGSGALLELANRIYNDQIFQRNVACLTYIPCTQHPNPGSAGSNNRRYNAIESLYYYEEFLRDARGSKSLRPLFVLSPSNNMVNLDADDGKAMKHLEYMGAMFLSRMCAAMDWRAISVDLNTMHGGDLHPWSISMTGVRIPALELKAEKILNSVEKICNPNNSHDPINWSYQPQIAAETISENAKQLIASCFKYMENEVGKAFDSIPSIYKKNFNVELTNNHSEWFGDENTGLANILVTGLMGLIMDELRMQMRSNPNIRSVTYIESLMTQIELEAKKIPLLSRADLVTAYSELYGDPPSPTRRRKLITWYLKHAFTQALSELKNKITDLRNALQNVSVSQEQQNVIKARKESKFYNNVYPKNFDVTVPSLSFLDIDSIFNTMKSRKDKINPDTLKKEILAELSTKTHLPRSTTFDRGWFSAHDAVNYMKPFTESPMVELKNIVGVESILEGGCFGGALNDMVRQRQGEKIREFENSIAPLGITVQRTRLDLDLVSLMSPLQIDAVKIWKHIAREKLTIGENQYQQNIDAVAMPQLRADYYELRLNLNLDVDVFKALITCTNATRVDSNKLLFSGVSSHYEPTKFSNSAYEYGITLVIRPDKTLFLKFNESGYIDRLMEEINKLTLEHTEFMSQWVQVINSKKNSDTGLSGRLDVLLQTQPFEITLQNGETRTIFRRDF